MVLTLFQASDATVDRILSDPPLIWTLVAPDEPELYEDARATSQGVMSRLFGKRSPAAALVLAPDEVELADLDKAWDGIHFLLSRAVDASSPLATFCTSGGTEIPGQEVGYCPARAYRASEINVLAAELEVLSDEVLSAHYDPTAMMDADVYPQIWDRSEPTDDPLAYLVEYLGVLRSALRTLATRHSGLIVTLS